MDSSTYGAHASNSIPWPYSTVGTGYFVLLYVYYYVYVYGYKLCVLCVLYVHL